MAKSHGAKVLYAGLVFLLVALPFYRVGFPMWIGIVLCAVGGIMVTVKNPSAKTIPLFAAISTLYFASELVWIIGSSNIQNSLQNLLLKLPLLILPLSLLATENGIGRKQLKNLFALFVGSTILAAGIKLFIAAKNSVGTDQLKIFYVDLSQNVHPGYYALLICMAILVAAHYRLGLTKAKKIAFTGQFLVVIFLVGILILLSARMQIIAMVLIVAIFSIRKMITNPSWKSAALGSFLAILIAGIGVGLVKHNTRVNRMLIEVSEISLVPGEILNSVESRLVVWSLGLEAALENPILGHGNAETKAVIQSKAKSQGFQQVVSENMGVHNEYLDAWITKGILGFILLLAMVTQPLYNSVKTGNHLLTSAVVLLGFSMLTESVLEREMGVILFATFVPLIMLYHRKEENAGS